LGLVLTSATSIFSLFTIWVWHIGHAGSEEKAKLSLIHPLQFSSEQDQIVVISSGNSSTGLFREEYKNIPLPILNLV
jgi:hypothetical protein